MAIGSEIVAGVARRLAERVGLELPAWVIEARASARIAALGVAPAAYVQLIESGRGQTELDELVESVRVGESRLFRHRSQIAALETVIAPALRARGARSVKVWSAGCSTGEEPFTLAAVLARALPGVAISILATDVSDDALANAATATYPRAAAADVPEPYQGAFVADDTVLRVRPDLAALVRFQRANLVDGTAPKGCDVVWCRNVLIYFTAAARRRVIDRLVGALAPGGALCVGYSESLRDIPELDAVRTGDAVYYMRKADSHAAVLPVEGAASPAAPAAAPLASPTLSRLTPPPVMLPRTPPPGDVLALRGRPDARAVTAELAVRLALPGLRTLVVDLDGAELLGDDLVPVLRRARAAAVAAGIEMTYRAVRPGRAGGSRGKASTAEASRDRRRAVGPVRRDGGPGRGAAGGGLDGPRRARTRRISRRSRVPRHRRRARGPARAGPRAGARPRRLARCGGSGHAGHRHRHARGGVCPAREPGQVRRARRGSPARRAHRRARRARARRWQRARRPDHRPPPAPAAPVAPAPGAFVWVPTVEDDMVDLFFDEATDRLEALAGKLVEIERRPGDGDLLRDVFRDLHTVKGSSAMVGLRPINGLAHAAEDLVGQIRDAGRTVDGPVVDALLAALDALRAMLDQARARAPITVDPSAAIARLRNPNAAPAAGAAEPHVPSVAEVLAAAAPAPAIEAARQTIRVDFDKLDRLMNLVGELVLGRDELRGAVSSLGSVTAELATDRGVARKVAYARSHTAGLDTLGDELSRVERVLAEVTTDLDHGTDRLDAISGELREQVMRLRMVPVAGVFRKHVRTVRDLAASLGKRARLELVGEETELDKLLVEALDEPLMHLVRNSVDHGIELPEGRVAAGKPPEGVVTLAAAHRGNQVEIRVADDGRGLDPDKLRAKAVERGLLTPAEARDLDDRGARELIFRAGFSTAAHVSEVSGRGVGMDVVRQIIITRLKGTIELESTPGQGSAVVLKLPLTLAIIQVIVARAGGETFAIPLDVVQRVLTVKKEEVALVGDREVVVVRGKHVPLIRLDHVLELDGSDDIDLQLVLVELGQQSYALVCDHLIGKREIVIKSLGKLLAGVPCVAGATLLGERVALILDVPAVIARALAGPASTGPRKARAAHPAGSTQVLLVEDSDIIRESLRRILADAGYLVTVAVDGQHGIELARSRHFDLVSTDVMMPRMDGYELTRTLRTMPEYADIPIVMVTSMGERIDRVRGFDAGVDEYITKPHDRTQLLRAVRKLLGHAGSDGMTEGPA